LSVAVMRVGTPFFWKRDSKFESGSLQRRVGRTIGSAVRRMVLVSELRCHQPATNFEQEVPMTGDQSHVTNRLSQFIAGSHWEAIPPEVRREGVRALLNFVGCAHAKRGRGRPPTPHCLA